MRGAWFIFLVFYYLDLKLIFYFFHGWNVLFQMKIFWLSFFHEYFYLAQIQLCSLMTYFITAHSILSDPAHLNNMCIDFELYLFSIFLRKKKLKLDLKYSLTKHVWIKWYSNFFLLNACILFSIKSINNFLAFFKLIFHTFLT